MKYNVVVLLVLTPVIEDNSEWPVDSIENNDDKSIDDSWQKHDQSIDNGWERRTFREFQHNPVQPEIQQHHKKCRKQGYAHHRQGNEVEFKVSPVCWVVRLEPSGDRVLLHLTAVKCGPWFLELFHSYRAPLVGKLGCATFPGFEKDSRPDEVEDAKDRDCRIFIQDGREEVGDETEECRRHQEVGVEPEKGKVDCDSLAKVIADLICNVKNKSLSGYSMALR